MSKINQYENDERLALREKNWNQRFVLGKIPKFDAYNDINYLSLGLLKSKLRYEERIKKSDPKSKYNQRIFSPYYTKSKSITKPKMESKCNYSIKKERFPSMRIYLNQNNDLKDKYSKKNSLKNSCNFPYQGTLTSYNLAGSNIFKFNPDYKNPKMNLNYIDYICEEDPEISDEYELLKDSWEKLGVTENYVKNFVFLLNNKYKNRDELLGMIKAERKQMKQFRIEFMKVLSEINKRENKIKDLKNFIKIYEEVITTEKKLKDLNEDLIKNIGEANKEKILGDIHDCLKSLRLKTINTVNALQKFKKNHEHLFNNKIDLDIIEERYGYNKNYLIKLKNDLDFLRDSAINKLYHFSEKGGDPFLLCISDLCGNMNDISKYKQIPISEEILNIVKKFMFFIEQEDVFNMTRQKKEKENNKDNNNYNNKLKLYNSYNNYTMKKNNDYYLNNEKRLFNNKKQNNKKLTEKNLLSNNFKGDIEKEKLRLKLQNEYQNVFFNTEEQYEQYPEKRYLQTTNNINNNNNHINNTKNKEIQYNPVKTEEKKYHIPGMTSNQFFKHLNKYSKIQNELFPVTNKEKLQEKVKSSIIQNIEDRMKKVEIDFKIKMEEKFKKEENKIKEEQKKIKTEKEKIEKLCLEEEEERRKKEEKYLKFEKEIEERKKKDKKISEENEQFEKREKEIFVKEMQQKFLNEVDERFKKEEERQIQFKKELINEAEKKEKERKEQKEKIRKEEIEKIKRGEVIVDLREKKKKVKKVKKKKNNKEKKNKIKEIKKSEQSETNEQKTEEEEEDDDEEEEEESDEEENEESNTDKNNKKNNNKFNIDKEEQTDSLKNKKEKNNKESSDNDNNISEDIEEEES